jgi:hypothetical protein
VSPLKALLPSMLRSIATLDQAGVLAEIGNVLSAELETPYAHAAPGGSDGLEGPAIAGGVVTVDLRRALWEGGGANTARLIYSLARFCEVGLGLP